MGDGLPIGTALQFAILCSILETRQTWELISHPTYDVHGAELSPDGNWVAFHLPRPRKRADRNCARARGKSRWRGRMDYGGQQRSYQQAALVVSGWQPAVLHFARVTITSAFGLNHLEPATKRPRGEPVAIHHLHETKLVH